VLAIGYLLVGFSCLWCHIMVEAASRFLRLLVEVVGGVGLAFVVEAEVAVGGGWVTYILDQTEALVSVPTGKEYRLPAGPLVVLLFLYQCPTALLWPAEPLPAFH
jgi:hypothetical protein